MTEIKQIALDRIHPNPHRDMKNYPINGEKVDALVRSIRNGDIGLWPSIIARPAKSGYEMAFGHHRLEAARKAGLGRIPLIVMDLNDEQMLQYMGRENGEEYGTDFMVLLNTWEAGARFLYGEGPPQNAQAIEIARLLGWVALRTDRDGEIMTASAKACSSAFQLITGGYMARHEFQGMSVETARNIAQRTLSMMEQTERAARDSKSDARQTEAFKNRIAAGARKTAAGVREGTIAPKQVRKQVEANALTELVRKKGSKLPPGFDKFVYRLVSDLNGILESDSAAQRLGEIEKVLGIIVRETDQSAVSVAQGSLGQIAQRATDWHRRLNRPAAPTASNVARLTKRGE